MSSAYCERSKSEIHDPEGNRTALASLVHISEHEGKLRPLPGKLEGVGDQNGENPRTEARAFAKALWWLTHSSVVRHEGPPEVCL